MMIVIKNTTKEEKETVDGILKEIEEKHREEIDRINAVLSAIHKCEKCKELDEAEQIILAARSPHIKALRTIKSATIVVE